MSIQNKRLYKVSPEGRPGRLVWRTNYPREILIDSLTQAGDTVQNSSHCAVKNLSQREPQTGCEYVSVSDMHDDFGSGMIVVQNKLRALIKKIALGRAVAGQL